MKVSWICNLLLAGCLISPAAKTGSIKATARLISVKDHVAEFEVTLSNAGHTAVYLEESLKGSHNLHAVDMEIEDAPDKWVRIGPKRDAAAASVFELGSGQLVSRNVSVYGLSDDEVNLLKGTRPKYRAVLRYFESREAWLSFSSSIGRKSKPTTIIGRAD